MSVRFLALSIPMLLALPGACNSADTGPDTTVLGETRRQLEIRGREDQEVRQSAFGPGGAVDSAKAAQMIRIDSANTAWLKVHVARWGWPTAEQIGRDAVKAAFLIVQHAVHDTAFMRAMLPHIEDAAHREELDGQALALLRDRLEVQAGHPQIYGTQASLRDGRWVLDPIADSVHVDDRRKAIGLPPLADYVRLLDSLLNQPPEK